MKIEKMPKFAQMFYALFFVAWFSGLLVPTAIFAQAGAGTTDGASPQLIEHAMAQEHYDLARSYIKNWDWKLAELELEVSIMHDPYMRNLHRDYCLVSLLRGHLLRSVAEFMMAVGLADPTPLSALEKDQLTARGIKLHYNKGLKYGRKGRWQNATIELQRALQYAPNKPAIVRSLAFSYACNGEFAKAEHEYIHSFVLDPTDVYSHADFAFILFEHGQNERAIAQLNEAIKRSPKVAALHVDMGWLAEVNGDLGAAESELQEAIRLSANHAGLWSHLGRILEKEGNAEEAKHAYLQALALDPGQNDARERLSIIENDAATPPANRNRAKGAS